MHGNYTYLKLSIDTPYELLINGTNIILFFSELALLATSLRVKTIYNFVHANERPEIIE